MIKKIAVTITLGLLLVFGLTATVFAQDDNPPGWDWERRNPILNQVAEILGMEEADLKAELEDGKTILEVAEDKGFTLEELVEKLSTAMQERMAAAIENGRLSQNDVEERIASMEECLTAYLKGEDIQCEAHFMSRNLPFAMGFRGRIPMMDRNNRFPMNMLETMAEKLNLTVEELKDQLLDGKRIPDIAESQGITREDLRAEGQEALIDRINQAVENGNLTQEEADEIIAWIKERPESSWLDRMGRRFGGKQFIPRP